MKSFDRLAFRFVTLAILIVLIGSVSVLAADKPQLTVWMKKHFVEASNVAFVKRAEQFGKEFNVDVKIELIPYEEFYPKWMAGIESKNLPDVSFFGYQEVGQFYGKGILRDISGLYKKIHSNEGGLYENLVSAVTFGGRQYAIPFWTEATVGYVRKDLLEKAGVKVPTTWEEWRAAAKATTSPKDGVYGAGIGYGRANSDAEWLTRGILWAYGGAEFTKDAKGVAIKSKATKDAFQFIADMFLKDESTPPGSVNWDDSGNNKAYLAGQAAMVFNTGSILSVMRTDRQDLLAKTVLIPLPAGPKGAYVAGICNTLGVFKTTKHPDVAEKFIAYMLDVDWYRTWIANSAPLTTPVYPALANDPIWKDPYNKAFIDSAKSFRFLGYAGEYTPAAGEVYNTRLINDAMQRILVDKWPVDKTIDELASRIKGVLSKY